ncbi:MAG TPA: DUF2867 domain-containing protein [Bradyrhizobium sp.]|uniref:DUF2867 domain-containing protein n=1 Tax=Bradyrhizobium sp. TaxID=376 RepID=UPI002D809584|nr:DUF2867 domain-containing protein [Bradyrhizobium sp.]HET7886904.1 DUF2867 domain-containing protein [Bradyrhizobium sp.]
MTIREIKPEVDREGLLAGAQFADAFRVTVADTGLDARRAAERMFSRNPRWVQSLVDLRNAIAAPFGLKTSGANDATRLGMIGLFPVLTETPERLVAGFNDHHLDFRVVVDVLPAAGAGREVTATTLVLTHNCFGRAYLAAIMPFHRMIAKTLLKQVDRAPASR